MIFKPYGFQRAGIDWIMEKPCCALFWGMGCGKTVTTLTAISGLLYDTMHANKVLVIAPLRVAHDTWAKECAKWEHLKHLRISKILGDVKARESAFYTPADIYVINRENVAWLVDWLDANRLGWPFDTVVIDELSSFKNQASQRFRALRRVRSQITRVIGLTGTPAPNGLLDLWPQIYLLDRGERLGAGITKYRSKYFTPGRSNGHIVFDYKPKPGAAEAIELQIADICMSLRKEDVLDLPGQIYDTVEIEPPAKLLKAYKKFERDRVMDITDSNGEILAMNAASLTNKLLQYANGAIYDEDRTVHHVHDLKIDALKELVEAANGEPVLVFYAYQHDRDRLLKALECRELATAIDINDWCDRKIQVAIAHPASVGHGLNLQSGGHIIVWFGLTWSLELYQQANERLNRPGQTDVCRVYHLVMKGTHDERVMRALQAKDTSQRALIDALKMAVEN